MKRDSVVSFALILSLVFGSVGIGNSVFAEELVEEENIEVELKDDGEDIGDLDEAEEDLVEDEEGELAGDIEDEGDNIDEGLGVEDKEEEVSPDVIDVDEINTVEDLKQAIEDQVDDLKISLGEDFPENLSESIVIDKLSDKDLTIDGRGKTLLNPGNMTSFVIKNVNGNIRLENLVLDGQGLDNAGGLSIGNGSGLMKLENTTIKNHNSAMYLGHVDLNLDNVEFIENLGGAGAGALGIAEGYSKTINIRKTSFIDNTGDGAGGYGGGAISGKFFRGNLNLDNSLFDKNKTNAAPTGDTIGGGGGAIFFNYFRGNLAIDNCYFNENRTSMKSINGKVPGTHDGGAIYIHDMNAGNKVDIRDTTFNKNMAQDDAGAVLIQVEGPGTTIDGINFDNNTFYGNEAYGEGDGSQTGGAIQIYINIGFKGSPIDVRPNFTNNTFYGNKIESDKSSLTGSAIAFTKGFNFSSGYTTNFDNNLFVDNTINGEGTESGVLNVVGMKNTEEIEATENNLGFRAKDENNKFVFEPEFNKEDIFGIYDDELVDDFSDVRAGALESSVVIPTLPIIPNVRQGVSAESRRISPSLAKDERGKRRDKDMGAVEIAYIEYNADREDDRLYSPRHSFKLEELEIYDGTEYYEGKDPVKYYAIDFLDDRVELKDGRDMGLDSNFIGWSRLEDSKTPDQGMDFRDGTSRTLDLVENTVLYPVYGEAEVEEALLVYKGNGNTGGEAPLEERVEIGKTLTLADKASLERKGYRFLGWSLDSKSSSPDYKAGETIQVNEDIVLYAVWEKETQPKPPVVEPPVEKPEGGNGSNRPEEPSKPSKPSQPNKPEGEDGKLNKEDHFAYLQGYPDVTVHPESNLSREEAATVFFRILDQDYRETIRDKASKYKDVKEDRWSSKHIGTLSKGKIVEGYKDSSFHPEDMVTRAEVATMIARFVGKGVSGDANFTDVKGHWAEDNIGYAYEREWIKGYEDGSFKPDENITRAEFATIINKLLERGTDLDHMVEGRKEFKDLEKNKWYYPEMEEALDSHIQIKEDGIERWLELKDFDLEM